MNIKIIECPRDAMQGFHHQIPTELKIQYINLLLHAGFDTIDFGSFVSPKAIPQMADTEKVLEGLNLKNSKSKLLSIIANLRGAEQAAKFQQIQYLGFPFSISETFQKRNTNSGITDSFNTIQQIQELCLKNNKEAVIYISMGFGNPYGDPWSPQLVTDWTGKLSELGIKIISLSDTVGVASTESISSLFKNLIPALPSIEFGAHLHSRPGEGGIKVKAAFENGCRRFDSAIKGFGGCPMAEDKLTGNLATEELLDYLNSENITTGIDQKKFSEAFRFADKVFY